MNLAHTLQVAALQYPDRPAVSEEGRTLDYGAMEVLVGRIAGGLRARHGLKPGDRVALWMDNTLEVLPLLYGIWRAGLTAVPVNAKLHAKELAWIVADSGAQLLFVTDALGAKLSELPSGASLPRVIAATAKEIAALATADPLTRGPTDPSDEAWLFYTSGTTGRPKGAVLTHRNLLFAVHAYYADIDFLGPSDTILHAAPLSHGSGLYGLAFVARGGHNVIIPGSFEPDRIYRAIAEHSDVSFFAAPTMVSRLINHPLAGSTDTQNLKTISYGGAPMYVADLERALELFGPKLFQLYGQGESPMTITGLGKAAHAARHRATASGSARQVSRAPASLSAWWATTGPSCRRARSARSSHEATA
ncbi:MAG TPA: AMP-binding protein [Hyphomicrobiaceae bacterium]|nr:AMP-binding protein [Hyphomicrobiaceae bacterium]